MRFCLRTSYHMVWLPTYILCDNFHLVYWPSSLNIFNNFQYDSPLLMYFSTFITRSFLPISWRTFLKIFLCRFFCKNFSFSKNIATCLPVWSSSKLSSEIKKSSIIKWLLWFFSKFRFDFRILNGCK